MAELAHMLVSMQGRGGAIHAYVICEHNKRQEKAEHAMLTLQKAASENDFPIPVPIGLVTDLDDAGRKLVQDFLALESPEATELIAKVEDYHLTAFILGDDHPTNPALMELH